MKKFISLLCAVCAALSLTLEIGAVQSTTFTYTLDRKGWLVRTQDAYLPDRTVTDLGLRKPEDMFFADDGRLFIADTGNKRIVVYDPSLNLIKQELKYDGFSSPRGVFVTSDNWLYVADSGAKAVFCFDENLEHVRTFLRPESAAFADTAFEPYRVAVDPRGSLYIIGEGVYNGIIQLSAAGEFLGYFASNKTTKSIRQFLEDIFLTEVQIEQLLDRVPLTFSNIFADKRGVIYSAAMGGEDYGENIKKHNMTGANMFVDGAWGSLDVTDLYVDKSGIIFSADVEGWITVTAPDGRLIFDFGCELTFEDIAGMFSDLASVAVSPDGVLWALDKEKAFLQSYRPTEYALSIYEALGLFNAGYYEQAGEVWNEVLRFNQMSSLAHSGLGQSYLYQRDYARAAQHFELAGNRDYYSEVYWETRNEWLLSNLYWVIALLIALAAISLLVGRLDRKKRVRAAVHGFTSKITEQKYLSNIFFAARIARHPLDSYYYLKRREKGSVWSALFWFIAFFAAFIIFSTSKAFIVQFTAVEDMDVPVVVAGFLGICALFIFCNYLVTSINDGEGGLKEIFMAFSYATLPFIGAMLAATALSYFMTYNEIFIYDMILVVGAVWSVILLYLGLQEIHNYNVKNNIKSLLITAAFILVVVVVLFNLTILAEQFASFIEAFARELIANVQGTV